VRRLVDFVKSASDKGFSDEPAASDRIDKNYLALYFVNAQMVRLHEEEKRIRRHSGQKPIGHAPQVFQNLGGFFLILELARVDIA